MLKRMRRALTVSRKDNKLLCLVPQVIYLRVGLEATRGCQTPRPIGRQSFQLILDSCPPLIEMYLALICTRQQIDEL